VLSTASCTSATYDTHDDLTISTQVKIALIADPRLGEFRIDAATLHGVVTLQGMVPSQADVDEAIAVARKVRGVKDVKSELKVGSYQLPASSGSGSGSGPGPVGER
jgi:osmotically-inducible protein OsmY